MTKHSTLVLIAYLLAAFCFSSVYAQSSRKPPVLQSGARATSQPDQPSADAPPAEVDEGGVLRVSTNLITVPAIVMDRNGRYIPNLRKEDFRLFDDGVEQELSYFASIEKPFTVALMLDVSGSTQLQLAQIRAAANTLQAAA
jgi:Ca-activated chloride channel family protein